MHNNFIIPDFTLGQLAQLTNGKLKGDPNLALSGINPNPLEAKTGELCLIFSNKFIKLLNQGMLKAGAYLVPSDSQIQVEVPRVEVKRPKLIIKQLLEVFGPKPFTLPVGIHPSAIIDQSASLGKDVRIGPLVYIGPEAVIGDRTEVQAGSIIGSKVQIGVDCLIHPRVCLQENSKIGNKVIIQGGAVIGADGFSYITEETSNLEKIQAGNQLTESTDLKNQKQAQLKVPSIGWVEIADRVEIGANTCIDRGTIGPTTIGQGTKIDNLVQIAHNCKIGENCLIIGQAGIAGSVILGDNVVIAGQSGCKDNIELRCGTVLVGASHAHKDTLPFSVIGGNPAIDVKEYIQKEKNLRRALRQIPKLKEASDLLKKEITKLKKESNTLRDEQ